MIQRLAAFILLLGALFSPSQTARACEPRPDYWFAEVYSIGSMLLPENVIIELSPRNSAKGYLLIHNNSETPLYVLPQDARETILVTKEPSIAEDGFAEENTPEEILLINQAPALAAFVLTNKAPLRLDIENLSALVPYIEERNILDFSRPGFVYLPITQRGEFHLVYEEQIFSVQFTISYALNENFNPEVCGEEIEPVAQQEVILANDANSSILTSRIAFTVIALVTLGAIIWLKYQGVRSRE
ncbi:MAG: hypothetical protein ISS57_16945 [Anaerolineales bacterium]|nr:hypothetical protein [Chloroflexota bacterium]MBL7164276.1 hypothetical protein [Anaerolineales bacterium]